VRVFFFGACLVLAAACTAGIEGGPGGPPAPPACSGDKPDCNGQGGSSGGQQGDKGPPFPIDPAKDPGVIDATGVRLDANGDLVLDSASASFNYLWIANTYDTGGAALCGEEVQAKSPAQCRGTVSKIDAAALREVARYFSVTCTTRGGPTGCTDANGLAIKREHLHTPSRTAVDFNFDVWVANRSVHGGQPSATKIANDPKDCIDRNKNGVIDTSRDQNGDGRISVDCNGDGQPDGLATSCTLPGLAGKPPEFLGDDDECVLFTVNYAEANDVGRSLCLDSGKNNVGASIAWVGTHDRPDNGRGANRFYAINGASGRIEATVELPAGHRSYGCTADAHHLIWSTDGEGSLAYFSSQGSHEVGPLLREPWLPKAGSEFPQYGIAVDGEQRLWLGGYDAFWVLRYKPDRSSFAAVGKGVWSRFDVAKGHYTRGVAADNRGKLWVAVEQGGILRIDRSLPDGVHDLSASKSYWKIAATTVIGVGVDTAGNVWGIGQDNSLASRLDVDSVGNVVSAQSKNVAVGASPYTYSDFTGYGLAHFVRPQGRYVYQHRPCQPGIKATWKSISWKATTPPGTQVLLRLRSGDSDASFGAWSPERGASPVALGAGSPTALAPNPASYLQVEFTLKNETKGSSPVLHEYRLDFACLKAPE
jgi:hypothetical protein